MDNRVWVHAFSVSSKTQLSHILKIGTYLCKAVLRLWLHCLTKIRLEAGVQAHIAGMKERRDGLAAQARPPETVIQAALADPEMVALGAGLNQRFAAILNSKDKGE